MREEKTGSASSNGSVASAAGLKLRPTTGNRTLAAHSQAAQALRPREGATLVAHQLGHWAGLTGSLGALPVFSPSVPTAQERTFQAGDRERSGSSLFLGPCRHTQDSSAPSLVSSRFWADSSLFSLHSAGDMGSCHFQSHQTHTHTEQ